MAVSNRPSVSARSIRRAPAEKTYSQAGHGREGPSISEVFSDALMNEHRIHQGGIAITTWPEDRDTSRTRVDKGENYVNDLQELRARWTRSPRH